MTMAEKDRDRTAAFLDLQEGRGPVPVLDDAGIERAMRATRRIAVVGASSNPSRPSFSVFRYLVQQGFECIPINPNEQDVLGVPAYRTLKAAVTATGRFDMVDVFRRSELCLPHAHEAVAETGRFDMVDVFRRSELCVPHAQEAAATGARVLWLQLGIVNWEAATIAHEGGLEVVMDRCTAIEWRRIAGR